MVRFGFTQTSVAKATGLGLFLATSMLPTVVAHGQIQGVTANGQYNQGPNIYWDDDPVNAQTAVRVMYKASGPAYNLPPDFTDDSKMACEGAAGAPKTIPVSAGSAVTIDWVGATSELLQKAGTGSVPNGENPWVHAMGTVANYIASCTNGDCTTYDASQADWVKLDLFGIDYSETISDDLRQTMQNKPEQYYPTAGTSGLWGMAKLVQDSSSWSVTVPSGLRNGQYILRHEIIAVHNPLTSDPTSGPQAYVGCIQLDVTDGGDIDLPSGTKAGSLYSPNGDFANYNVYNDNGQNFVDPGPAIWNPSSSSSGSSSSSDSTPASSTDAPAPTSTDVAVATTSSASDSAPTATQSSSGTKCRKRSVKRDSKNKMKKMKKRNPFPHFAHKAVVF